MRRLYLALASLVWLLAVGEPVRAAGDLDKDLGAGQPGISVFALGVTVQGFKDPPPDAVPLEVLDVQIDPVLEPGCGPSQTLTVAMELEPCPENVWFIVDSPELEEPIVYEMLGIRRALRFNIPAEVESFSLIFVETDGRTTIPLSITP